jgi:hypothetical protein
MKEAFVALCYAHPFIAVVLTVVFFCLMTAALILFLLSSKEEAPVIYALQENDGVFRNAQLNPELDLVMCISAVKTLQSVQASQTADLNKIKATLGIDSSTAEYYASPGSLRDAMWAVQDQGNQHHTFLSESLPMLLDQIRGRLTELETPPKKPRKKIRRGAR